MTAQSTSRFSFPLSSYNVDLSLNLYLWYAALLVILYDSLTTHNQIWQIIYTAIIAIYLLKLLVAPPACYPDLFPGLNVLVNTPMFMLIWLWTIKHSVEVSWAFRRSSTLTVETVRGEVGGACDEL